jgi:c-di-GMP-binding flagellar brake protein YcgR
MAARPAEKMEPAHHDKRRHRRVELILTARFMLPDRSEHTATLLNISAGGLALKTEQRPAHGTSVIVYVQDIGRLEGPVMRILPDGFAIAYNANDRMRDKVMDKLTCKINPEAYVNPGDRVHARIEASDMAHLILSDGRELVCRVLDMSFGGIGLAVEERPKIGEPVLIGRMQGRVVRHHDQGIGVAFDTVHTSWGSLAQSIKRPRNPNP